MKAVFLALAFTVSAATAHASSQPTSNTTEISENQVATAAAIVVVLGLCLFTSACESGGEASLPAGKSGVDEYGQLHCYLSDWQTVPECADSDTAQEARRKD